MTNLNLKTNSSLCRVRTITTFITLDHDKTQWKASITKATQFCTELSNTFAESDYVVQSIRIVTNNFGEYIDTSSTLTAMADLQLIRDMLLTNNTDSIRVRFAIGAAETAAELALLPQLIQEFGDLCNACINIPADHNGIMDNELLHSAAQTVQKISRTTPRGEGNFNFTVNFNCSPLIPYFPAGYHQKEHRESFVLGLETPDLLVATLNELKESAQGSSHNSYMQQAYTKMLESLQQHVDQIIDITQTFSKTTDSFHFSGIDSSAAPSKDCASMVELYQLLGVEYFGASGTIEASSLLTKVFKSVKNVNLVGFSGLMLAVTEDKGLASATQRGEFDIRALLTYSAVCGIGLDTVPIPGDTPIEKITALMRDTGTMAFRLQKPLTVRLFPVPGLSSGDLTQFESDDLCNCAVLAVP